MPSLPPTRSVSFFSPREPFPCLSGQSVRQPPRTQQNAVVGGAVTMLPAKASDLAEEAADFLADQVLSEMSDGLQSRSVKHLLLPYTDSQSGQRALEAVAELSSVLVAKIRVLHFRAWEPARGGPIYFETPEDAVALTRDAVERLRQLGLEASGSVRDAARMLIPCEIVARADQLGACAIFLGTRRHVAITAKLLGSISQGVMRRASCPVIIVRSWRGWTGQCGAESGGRDHANR